MKPYHMSSRQKQKIRNPAGVLQCYSERSPFSFHLINISSFTTPPASQEGGKSQFKMYQTRKRFDGFDCFLATTVYNLSITVILC